MQKTKIEYLTHSWNPIAMRCTPVSEGCENCWHLAIVKRFKNKPIIPELSEKELEAPLKSKKPSMIGVQFSGDLFHESVPFEWIDKVMAIITLCPQHIFQCLSKRPKRMLEYFNDSNTPFRITKALDVIKVNNEASKIKEKIKPINGFEGYFVSNKGYIYSAKGSGSCVNCGKEIKEYAKSKYCSKKCLNHARYIKQKTGEYPLSPTLCKMSPEIGGQGHQRIMLYKNTAGYRFLVHRIVLEHFDRLPKENEQCCHIDSNPLNNHICNLRWGSQSDNWADSKRHGTFNRYKTQNNNIKPQIQWPLLNVNLGVTCENQKCADKRIPILLQIPASKRFVSIEPMLEEIDLRMIMIPTCKPNGSAPYDCLRGTMAGDNGYRKDPVCGSLDWVIVGCESGPGRRPCKLEWVRNIVAQCRAAGVAVFVKQLSISNKVIHDIEQFPEDLQIREYPEVQSD